MRKNKFLKLDTGLFFIMMLLLMFINSIFSKPINIEHLETIKGRDTINNSVIDYKHSSIYTSSSFNELSTNTSRIRNFSYNDKGITDELSEEVSLGQQYIILLTDENMADYTVGEYICIKNSRSELIEIASIDRRTIELSWQIQNNYDTNNTTIFPRTTDMCKANITDTASLENPVVFCIEAGTKEKFHIRRIMVTGSDSASMNFEEFLGFTALTNGCILGYHHIDPLYEVAHNHYIYHFHTNGDFANLMFDLVLGARTGGSYGLQGRFSLDKFSGGITIDGSKDEYMIFNIRDNLEAGDSLKMSAQGWIEFLE